VEEEPALGEPDESDDSADGDGEWDDESEELDDDDDYDDDEAVRPRKAPWHFKVLLVGTVIYLGWRAYQGVSWLVHHVHL
jgi:hypothetical protein